MSALMFPGFAWGLKMMCRRRKVAGGEESGVEESSLFK